MIRRALVAAGCLVMAAHVAFAQEAPLLPSDREASAQLAKIIETTAAAGLPVGPIITKVNYGRNVARSRPEGIVAAARLVASRLEIAREALAPNPTSSDIEAGAKALGDGATKESLQAIRLASRPKPVAVPLGFLSQLISKPNQVQVDTATAIVTRLIRMGAKDAQLAMVGNDVNSDIANGWKAIPSIETRIQGLAAVLSPGGSTAASADAFAPGFIGQATGGRSNPPPPKRP